MDATEVIHESDQSLNLDDLNRQILKEVGKRILPASITDILRPFRDQRVYSSLYDRIRGMEKQGLLKTNKQKHHVFVTITEKGQKIGGVEIISSSLAELNSKLEETMKDLGHIERIGWLVDRLYHELNETEA